MAKNLKLNAKGQEDIDEVKVILIGDSGVGKTNLINTSLGKSFQTYEDSTVSPSYSDLKLDIGGKKYILNLWDTAGQEKYLKVTKLFFKGSGIIILVYDITNPQSFENLKKWYQICEDIIETEHIYGLVGNKNDLFLDSKVLEEDAKKYAKSINSKFSLVSAKSDTLFLGFLEELLATYKKIDIKSRRKSVKLKQENLNTTKTKGNCMGCE